MWKNTGIHPFHFRWMDGYRQRPHHQQQHFSTGLQRELGQHLCDTLPWTMVGYTLPSSPYPSLIHTHTHTTWNNRVQKDMDDALRVHPIPRPHDINIFQFRTFRFSFVFFFCGAKIVLHICVIFYFFCCGCCCCRCYCFLSTQKNVLYSHLLSNQRNKWSYKQKAFWGMERGDMR